jgi:hypothetical protein
MAMNRPPVGARFALLLGLSLSVLASLPLADLTLHVCFQRNPDGCRMQQAFTHVIGRMDMRKIESGFFQKLEPGAGAAPDQ